MTTSTLPGYEITEVIGVVSGQIVVTRNVFADIFQNIASVFGGRLEGYTKMLKNARSIAKARCINSAMSKGGNALLCMRYETS